MKLRKLHIEDYKMFKDFEIDFVDENDKALPIVVLAGTNGSGKTTLLESLYVKDIYRQEVMIHNLHTSNEIEFSLANMQEENTFISELSIEELRDYTKNKNYNEEYLEFTGATFSKSEYYENIIFFPSGINDTKRVADEFVKTFYDFLKNKDYRPSEVKEHFDTYMKDIFEGLDLTFNYSHLDKEDNVWFTNNEDQEFKINQLSTGEKTLLSKILYIYFKDYKDKVILIDEPELSLHPSWQNKILSVYERLALKNNCQIIIATHSPHIIGSAKPEYLRVLKKEADSIKVEKFTQSYGLEFSQILTDIMGVEYLRTPEVAKKMSDIEEMIVHNQYDTNDFKKEWDELERLLGKEYLDLKLLRLEIASRKKNA